VPRQCRLHPQDAAPKTQEPVRSASSERSPDIRTPGHPRNTATFQKTADFQFRRFPFRGACQMMDVSILQPYRQVWQPLGLAHIREPLNKIFVRAPLYNLRSGQARRASRHNGNRSAHRSATTNGNGNTKPVGEAGQNAGAVAGTPEPPNTPELQSESPELRQSTKLIAKILRPCKHDSCCFAFLMQIRCCTMSGSRLSCSRAIVSIVLRCFSMCLSSICPRPKRGTKAVEPTVERVVCRQHARVRSVRPDNCGDPHQLDCATYRTYTTY
jgi:hypothetical protein